ncbi:hypothetical protein F2Q70_00026952 [Brassica cretica]|uniref:Uncharacterized protein n=1 Tax=Brassica cretica TaxID=69181 RepID=A0A8S9LF27_BRACR|nr:hypothetical protein F2Q70_00026952 [Brassica cretica]
MLMSSIVTESESIVYWLIVHTIKDWVVEPAREGSYKSRCCKRDGYIVSFEGRRRTVRLRKGLQHSGDNVDTLIVIPNDMLLTAVSLFRLLFQKHSIWQMICFVKGYRGISDNITIPGLVNVDFADVRAIMANAGSSLMGVGTATDAYCYRLPLKWNQSDNVCVLVIIIIIIIIFGTVVDPSFSGQVSITNSNRLQTPRRRRKEATSGLLHFVSLNNTQYTLDSYNLFYMKTQGTQVDASMGVTRRSSSSFTEGSEIEEELRDMKAHKAYYNMLHFVANAQQGIPKMCPCGSITKESSMKRIHMTTSLGKDTSYAKTMRQPWVMGMQQEVERLKERPGEDAAYAGG